MFSLKMLLCVGMKTAPLTQYVRRSSHEKFLFTENARRGWYKRAPLTQYVKQS